MAGGRPGGRAQAGPGRVGAAWGSEPAPVRAEFLDRSRRTCAPEDEAFLEAALDDRAQDVRRLAAELLSGLPDSGLGKRMAERTRALVDVQRRTMRRPVLAVGLPAECDAALRRDGVVASPSRGGERTWWLRQIVAATPLATWTDLGYSPAELLRLTVEGCEASVLHECWAAAAVRQRDLDWARALLAAEPDGRQVADLVSVLPREQWADAVVALARRVNSAELAELVVALPQPWPTEFGTAMLDWLTQHADHRVVARAASVIARSVPRECLDHPLVTGAYAPDAAAWRRQLTETLQFRREMYEELA